MDVFLIGGMARGCVWFEMKREESNGRSQTTILIPRGCLDGAGLDYAEATLEKVLKVDDDDRQKSLNAV
jgi:hypothetical protein